ncbi:protein hydE [Helicobacter cynogastricus]|uniref:protein hydE n=1 Tax=Helicobacter cynogastricus TaxID=329937 RepID=UPI000CF1113C|nr:protein hydE [Helicobacter cynogastricus]
MVFVFKFQSVGEVGAHISALFMDFLAHHAHAQNLAYATALERFFLQASEQEAQNFAQILSDRLPLSLSFSFLGVELSQEKIEWQTQPKECPLLDILQEREALEKCLLKPYLSAFRYKNEAYTTPAQIQSALEQMTRTLQEGDTLTVQTTRGLKKLSCTPLEGAQVLFLDLASVLSCTRADHKSAQVLCALEKPSMIATLKEVFVNEFKSLEICACLPYDFGLALLARALLKKEIAYLFMADSSGVADFSYICNAPSLPAQVFSVGKSALLLPHAYTHAQDTLEFVRQEAPKEPHLLIYLNFERPSCFWVYEEGYKQLIDLSVPTHPSAFIAQLKSNAKGRKLYANYQKAYPELCTRLEQEPSTPPEPSTNLLDFLGGLVRVLGFENTHNPRALFTHAKSFLRSKGPHIDFKLAKNPPNLNPAPTIRSAVSYTLGGTDVPTMCFGILDSLAEFLGNVIYDAQSQFKFNQVYLCGDVFLEKVFLDLCLEYFPKGCLFPLTYMDYQQSA